MKKVSTNIFYSILMVSLLVFSNGAFAQSAQQSTISQYIDVVEEIDAALAAGDENLASTIISKAITSNPKLAAKLASYVATKSPSLSVKVVEIIQKVAPKQEAKIVAAITKELAKNPKNETVLAQVLDKASPAARPGNTGNQNPGNPDGTPSGLQNAINKVGAKKDLPKGLVENPNLNSDS